VNDADLLKVAERVCTAKELEAYHLVSRGLSERAVALALGLSRSAVRGRLENARRKIDQERKAA
jgi:DNA-binding CsgD family transcriptional regulator